MGPKSRGNWQVLWCPKTDCKHHGTKACDKCFKEDLYSKKKEEKHGNRKVN